jgi:hypothetical protein
MIHEFSFHIKKGDYIILHTTLPYTYYSYPKNLVTTIPTNSVLRIDKLNIKTDSSNPAHEIEFYFLVKKNKHIKSDSKIPNKIVVSIYELNGVKYSIVKEENIDTTVNSLLRKHKIECLLSE